MFHVGQKVVFIGDMSHLDGANWVIHNGLTLPVKDQIYTIRRMVQRPGGEADYGVMLVEIVNPHCPLMATGYGVEVDISDPRVKFEETAFAANQFRPLITVEDFETASVREDA